LDPLPFQFYINDLPKIVPYNSKPTFADDTSLIFSNPSYLDFKTTINNEFSQLNKWFVNNSLLLNYEKTQCVHFTLKHPVLYEAPIGYNNNFFSKSTITKFFGVITENTLSWKAHIDHLLPKLCMA